MSTPANPNGIRQDLYQLQLLEYILYCFEVHEPNNSMPHAPIMNSYSHLHEVKVRIESTLKAISDLLQSDKCTSQAKSLVMENPVYIEYIKQNKEIKE